MIRSALLLLAALALLLFAGCATTPASGPRYDSSAVADVFERYITASGGRATLAGAQTLFVEEDVVSERDGARISYTVLRCSTTAGLFSLCTTFAEPGGITDMAFNGEVGWRRNAALGFSFLSPAECQSLAAIFNPQRAVRVSYSYRRQMRLPDSVVHGRACHTLLLTPNSGTAETWHFDAVTGQLLRIESPGLTPEQSVALEFDDYRIVDGQIYPFVERRFEAGTVTTTTRKVVRFNRDFPDTRANPSFTELTEAAEADRILNRYAASLGDLQALASFTSRYMESVLENKSSGTKTVTRLTIKRPNRVLVEEETPGIGLSARGYDGTTGWSANEVEGYRELTGLELAQFLGSADLYANARLPASAQLRRLLPATEVSGHPVNVLALATMQGPLGTFYFSKENGRLLRVDGIATSGTHSSVPMQVEFSDFRLVDGVIFPFVITATNPAMRLVTTVTSLQHNVPVDDAIFRPRREDE